MKIFNKKEFIIVILNLRYKIFIIYIASILKSIIIIVYLSQTALITFLNFEKVTIFSKYFYFTIIFSFNSTTKFLEYIDINNYFIYFVNNKQYLYSPIYSL